MGRRRWGATRFWEEESASNYRTGQKIKSSTQLPWNRPRSSQSYDSQDPKDEQIQPKCSSNKGWFIIVQSPNPKKSMLRNQYQHWLPGQEGRKHQAPSRFKTRELEHSCPTSVATTSQRYWLMYQEGLITTFWVPINQRPKTRYRMLNFPQSHTSSKHVLWVLLLGEQRRTNDIQP